MKLYINSLQSISSQKTFDTEDFFDEVAKQPQDGCLYVVKPEYKNYIDARQLRRMSGVIRNGVAASNACLRDAGVAMPDAILVGTGLGCIADTVKFLNQMNENNESMMAPTSFILSTHNSVSGQIALLLKSHGHNLTFVQKTLSFESALIEAMMLAAENPKSDILLGGIDELIPEVADLIKKTDCYLHSPQNIGEGATFFMVSGQKKDESLAAIIDVATYNERLTAEELYNRVSEFLKRNNETWNGIDVVVSGCSNVESGCGSAVCGVPEGADVVSYKSVVGDYDTASAFGLWLGAKMLQAGRVPAMLSATTGGSKEKGIYNKALVVNSQSDKCHSLILLQKC